MKRDVLGVLVGTTVIVSGVILTFVGVALSGLLPRPEGTVIDLTPWLWLETVGGGAAAAVGGCVCRRIARRRRAVWILAAGVLIVGMIEAGAIAVEKNATDEYTIVAPVWLAFCAPAVGSSCVALSGWRRG